MPWPLYLALRQLFPSGRWLTAFTAISVLGVAVGVMLMLVASSIMGGFGHQIRAMIVDTQGEIQVRGRRVIHDVDAVARIIREVPGVTAESPFAEGVVMIENRELMALPGIRSVDPERMGATLPLDRYLLIGKLADLDDDSVILSSLLAQNIGARPGDVVSVYTPLMLERMKQDEILLPRELRVIGVFEIGHQHLDSSLAVTTLRTMQDLFGLDAGIHGFNVRLAPDADVFTVARALNHVLPDDCRALTWYESTADFQAILAFERNMIFILMSVIVIVAAFTIMASLLMSVVRKTREIGLIGAMGGRASEVAACFCLQGMISGLIGIALGLGLGFLVLHYREAIVLTLSRLTIGHDVFVQFYQFYRLPAHTEPRTVVTIVIFAFVASTLAGLIPAWRAARLKPVEALRSE